MSVKRFYWLMSGVIVLLCLVIGAAVYGGLSVFQKQSSKLLGVKTEAKVIEDQKLSLIKAKKDIEKYSELNDISKAIVPQDKDQAKTVREINKIAEELGIKIEGVTFGASTLGEKTQPQPKPQSSEEGGGASKQPSAPPVSQTLPVPGINGVYSLEIVIITSKDAVSYYTFLDFLERLETNRRTAHVTKISVSPTKTGSDVTFSLTLNAYIKP